MYHSSPLFLPSPPLLYSSLLFFFSLPLLCSFLFSPLFLYLFHKINFLLPNIKEDMQDKCFWADISLPIVFSFIHVFITPLQIKKPKPQNNNNNNNNNNRISLFVKTESRSSVQKHHIFYMYSSVGRTPLLSPYLGQCSHCCKHKRTQVPRQTPVICLNLSPAKKLLGQSLDEHTAPVDLSSSFSVSSLTFFKKKSLQ